MDLFDIFQQYKNQRNHREALDRASRAKSKAFNNEVDINTLDEKIDHLSMLVMAMGELLEDVGINKEMIVSKVEEIDLRDGKLDGKLVTTKHCPSCKRTVSARHIRCLYCGHED